MKLIKNYQKFIMNEDVDSALEDDIHTKSDTLSPVSGNMTLYRLTSHPVVDLSAPGEFYVKSMDDLNPDFLENKEGNSLFVITINCPGSNVNLEQSEKECARHNCENIIAVNDDTKCEIVSVEPYKK